MNSVSSFSEASRDYLYWAGTRVFSGAEVVFNFKQTSSVQYDLQSAFLKTNGNVLLYHNMSYFLPQ